MDRVQYRRKREGKTNYRKRLQMLLGARPRLVVRRTSRQMIVQLVDYGQTGDMVRVTARSAELAKHGWKYGAGSVPAAYLTGYLAGKKCLAKGFKEAILDSGMQNMGERIFAALKGAVDAGLQIPHGELKESPRLKGEHIAKYSGAAKEPHFKAAGDVSQIVKVFEQTKERLA